MIQRYEVWEDNYYKREDGDWCKAQDALLQDAALDVLAGIRGCGGCPLFDSCKCIETDEGCKNGLKVYALEEARRRMG